MNVCTHSIEQGMPSSYYENLARGELRHYGFESELSKPQDSYFDSILLRDLAALRFAKSVFSQWNGKVVVGGSSQAGFRSIAVAALDKDVVRADTAGYPWLCDIGGVTISRMRDWQPPAHPMRYYFDTLNFAKRVKCPVVVSAGMGDYFCPPSGIMAMYNVMNCPVKLIVRQNAGHCDGEPREESILIKNDMK